MKMMMKSKSFQYNKIIGRTADTNNKLDTEVNFEKILENSQFAID